MSHSLPALLFLAGLLVTATGCSNKTSAATAPAPPDVEIAEVQQRDVPIYGEWIGTLDGLVNADIKAQVSGYLLEQAHKEGTFVKKGQLLFQIDPRPFQAIVDQTEGQLAQARAQQLQAEAQIAVAEANQRRTQLDVDRYTPLAQQQAITLLKEPGVEHVTSVLGFRLLSDVRSSYGGFAFINLKEWSDRKKREEQLQAIKADLNRQLGTLPEGVAFTFSPPAIPGVGTSGGFTFILEDRSGQDVQLACARKSQVCRLLSCAACRSNSWKWTGTK